MNFAPVKGSVRSGRASRLAGLSAALLLLAVAACTTAPPPSAGAIAPRPTYSETGNASWYGAEHAGAKTASGAPFDPAKATAAHRSLPLRTVARVTNTETGHSVKVVINDRGPFVRSRIIDVSAKAAQILGIKKDGIVRVRVEVLAEDQTEADGIAAR
jgi:rare lipoprotein A